MRLRLALPVFVALVLGCKDPVEPDPAGILSVVAGSGFSCALVGERIPRQFKLDWEDGTQAWRVRRKS